MSPPEYGSHNRRVVCKVVLFGTCALVATIAILLLISFSLGNPQALSRFTLCVAALFYMAVAKLFLIKHYHRTVAYMLLLFYTLLAGGIVLSWGINTPLGILLFGLVIVLAGILLTARHAFLATLVAGSILAGVQLAITFHWHMSDVSWTSAESSFGDVIAYCTVFGMLALVSWLYNREVERSLAQAAQAEAALLLQKATLEQQVEKRTVWLRKAQLEEMQQMYRFAELGQLGITLLHDLANHLTALTLEVDDLRSKEHSTAITRVRRITRYLEKIVDNTRERLRGNTKRRTFNVIQRISDTLAFLHYKADRAHMIIDWHPPIGAWKCTGDPDSLGQVIAILTNNAIDAGSAQDDTSIPNARSISITIHRDATDISIRINDWGKGITKSDLKTLFKPFHSTKRSGMGLGLYIAKQTVELEFAGTLEVDLQSDHTEFIIKLPRAYAR